MNKHILTKTKINSGLQCQKKLWYDFHEPIKSDNFLFHLGNRFGEVIRNNYGKGLDLSNIFDNEKAINETKQALLSKNTKVIYEAAFMYLDTLVRTDVLIRDEKGWHLLEAKSSTKLKDEHIPDIAIQSFIVRSTGINVTKMKLLHINSNFIYEGNNDYKNLINEVDVSEEVILREKEVEEHINNFKSFADKNSLCPEIGTGPHCKKPHDCIYQGRCNSVKDEPAKVSYEILPNKGKKLLIYCKENDIINLEDIPPEKLNDNHKVIQSAHKNNKEWVCSDLKLILKSFEWPFYFIDFETINQGVPKIKGTAPYYAMPFQWSVHKWNSPSHELKLEEGISFLDFENQDIELKFVESLLETVQKKGTVFAHNAPTEKNVLKKLKDKNSCKHLALEIDDLLERIVDTLVIVKKNFYHPKMNGEYGIKKIIKSIPASISYEEEDNIEGGVGAQLAWFICTDQKTTEAEKKRQIKLLKEYCAKDTMAIYDLIKYLLNIENKLI
ncbi:DUF2779 domain-containing protein [Candidatus Pelagibacter ubique]|nr:DUF2779 domain-containing protein [Candidatus Pelagibacter ubique]